jgi:hypothetical protein
MRTSLLHNPREGEHLEDLSVDDRIRLKAYDKIEGEVVPTGFIWPRIGIIGGLL